MSSHVVVVGAGMVGVATAWELLADGHRVTIVEPGEPGGTQAASFGNGGWISPASVVPMSVPGIWLSVPGYLMDPDGPLTIRWSKLPKLMPWLVRYLLAGATRPRVEATARALASLLHDAPDRHAALAETLGCPEMIRRTGLLYAYRDRAAFAADALGWDLRRQNAVGWRELEGEALAAAAPDLDPRYGFGALVESGAWCREPGAWVAKVAAAAIARGAELRATTATGFATTAGRLIGVETAAGTIACDAAVVAAGIRSKELAKKAGDAIPLESERGYCALIADAGIAPAIPIMPADGKMANTDTANGFRLSGQVELADVDCEPNWERVEVLLRHAARTYPKLGRRADLTVERWYGHRPSTPDGRPVIGRASGIAGVVYAFGHGHVGLSSGPKTGRLAADLVAGTPPAIDLAPFSPTRFHRL
jgi:D-amino-acid dehydrogenase